jgi:ribulose-5-phosphate 4-epimerase/fuculose-1-phosphate aldolase
LTDQRDNLALALRALAREGFFAFPFGHMSLRGSAGSEAVLILRHLHHESFGIEDVSASDIIGIEADGSLPPGRDAPGERYIHTEIYARRPDVGCVLHYHSRLTAAFGRAGRPLVPQTPLGGVLGPVVPVHDYGGQIDSPAKGAALAESLGKGAAITLPAHGAVVVGAGVEEVAARALALEDCCAVELTAAQLGAEPAAERPAADDGTSSEVHEVLWAHLLRKHGLGAQGD